MQDELKSLSKEFQEVQNKQQEIISRDINNLRSNLTATTNNLADVEKSIRSQNEEFKEQLKSLTTEVNKLRVNLTEAISRVGKQSMASFSGLSSRVDTESSLIKARPSN